MSDILQTLTTAAGFGSTVLRRRFDAERDTPELLEAVDAGFPEIRQIVASLRRSLPLACSSRAGEHVGMSAK